MNYKKIKNVITFLMLQAIVFSVIGCTAVEEGRTDNGETYSGQIVISDWMQASISRIGFHNDVVYFTTYEEIVSEDGENYCNNRLYSVNKDGSDLTEIPIDLTKEDALTMITGIMTSADDTISIWLSSYDSIDANDINVFIKVDSTGKELIRKDMNTLVNGQYVNKVLGTEQGYIIAMAENNVYIFDESLELMKEIDIKGHPVGMAFAKENRILCVTEDSNAKKQFQTIDMERGEVVETVTLGKEESVDENGLFASPQYDVCYRNDKGIYCYDIENKKPTCFSFDHQIGISSGSKVKDGAWEFLHMLLSYEYQEQYADLNKGLYKIPIRQDCFDLLMTRLSNPQEDMETFEEDSDIISSSQGETFRKLVANTHKAVSYNIEMMRIVEEEAQSYFEGYKSENETAQIIQNRCITYMNEMR